MQFGYNTFKKIFIVMLCCGTCFHSDGAEHWEFTGSVSGVNCGTSHYGTDDTFGWGAYNGVFSDPTVYLLDHTPSNSDNWNHIDTDGSSGTCDFRWCRICKSCDSVPVANFCGTGDGLHAERTTCDNVQKPFTAVSNTRACTNFYFGPILKDSNNNAVYNYKKRTCTINDDCNSNNEYLLDLGFDVKLKIGSTLSDISFYGDDCTFDKVAPNYTGGNCLNHSGWSVSRFFMKRSISESDNLKCHSGELSWRAQTTAGGDLVAGFYVIFKKSASGDGTYDPKFTCNNCYTGYTTSTIGPHTVCHKTCDTANNFTNYSSYCACKKGYIYNGSTCVRDTSGKFSEVWDSEHSGYYCAVGYTPNEVTPSSSNNYVRYTCVCNSSVFSNANCTCPDGYAPNDGAEEDPENATCELDTTSHYYDITGRFSLKNSPCPSDWWNLDQEDQ